MTLLSVFDRLVIPRAVFVELADDDLRSRLDDIGYDLIDVSDPEPLDSLQSGETAAITITNDLQDAVLLTDDLDAREVASRRNIEVHGSVGIIALAVSRGLIDRSEAVDAMRSLQWDANLFVTEAVIERGIELLKQY